jgi:hypothetical protein
VNTRVVQVAGAALLFGLITAGCSTQAPRVDCDGRLEPINRPAPQMATGPVLAEQTEAEPVQP